MQMLLSHNIILPKYLRIVKEKGSRMSKTRAREGGVSVFSALFSSFRISAPLSARSKNFRAKPKQAGKKEGLGGRNFCPPASVPVPFEQRKSGRGFGGNSAFPLRNQIEASPATCLNTWKAEHRRKILFSLKEEKIGRAQNEKSKEYFSVVWRSASWRRAVAVFFGRSSNFNQKTPPKFGIQISVKNMVGTKCFVLRRAQNLKNHGPAKSEAKQK